MRNSRDCGTIFKKLPSQEDKTRFVLSTGSNEVYYGLALLVLRVRSSSSFSTVSLVNVSVAPRYNLQSDKF